MKRRFELITFLDHTFGDNSPTPASVEAIGEVIFEASSHIVLAHWIFNGDYRDNDNEFSCIIKGTITSRRSLK